VFLRLIWETVIWDMLTRASTPTSRATAGRLQVPGGHGHAEVDSSTAADDPIDVGRFEQVSDHHLGASGPQGRCSIVLAADHGANRKPAIEEQPGHGAPDRAELTGCSGYEDRSVIQGELAAIIR
jgi:hypothetical protein